MLDADGFIVPKGGKHRSELNRAIYESVKQVEFMSRDELLALPVGSPMVYDVETYPNFWFVAFKSLLNNKFVVFEQSPDCELDRTALQFIMWRFCLVGFNSRIYDLPIVTYACAGNTCETIYHASMRLINESMPPFIFEKEYEVKIPNVNHVDLIEVAPLQASLKTYSGRLHCRRMQDLPFSPYENLTRDEAEIVRLYCCNDLDNTQLLALHLYDAIKLREELGREYGIDLRSKSDAQIAEAVITSELVKLTGSSLNKSNFDYNKPIRYVAPLWVKFDSPHLNAALWAIQAAEFWIGANGSAVMPDALNGLELRIGSSLYRLGIGGLHSSEKCTAHVADEQTAIIDRDVASYYPSIILNERLYPKHLGEAFLNVYRALVDRRLLAKKQGNKTVADALKITINGSFGKLGNKYSALFAPDLLLQVTITGQLALLMLIEIVESVGIPVVSGNTDGIVIKCPFAKRSLLNEGIRHWESLTGFVTEETEYAAIYSRDVNNYIAIKPDRTTKAKGVYSEVGSALNSPLSKNPECLICADAVKEKIGSGTAIAVTIKNCRDIRRFVTVRNVKGGAEKAGTFLGKVVRFYYAKGEPGSISYMLSGNKVPKSDGAKPLMDLPEEFPEDINYEWYIREATEMLYDIGFYKKATSLQLF